jgi:aminopeptidase N
MQLRFVAGGETIDKRVVFTEAREVFFFPLPEQPTQFIFDSGANILKTAEVKKPVDLWRHELLSAARAIDRVVAARALRELADPLALDGLIAALQKDPFWAVRGEAALAIGALKSEAARLALFAALISEKHAKARRLVARALGEFPHDSQVGALLKQTLVRGDESYFVEAELAISLGKSRDGEAFATLREVMTRPSYLDAIASACLQGMAQLRDEAAVPIARKAATYGAPAIARRAAILAMGALGAEFSQHRHALREDLEELLVDPDFRARIAAVEGLRILGDLAGSGALAAVANRDLDGRVRRRAREAVVRLAERNHHDGAVALLRDGVERLDRENRELRSRLDQLSTGPRPVDERG